MPSLMTPFKNILLEYAIRIETLYFNSASSLTSQSVIPTTEHSLMCFCFITGAQKYGSTIHQGPAVCWSTGHQYGRGESWAQCSQIDKSALKSMCNVERQIVVCQWQSLQCVVDPLEPILIANKWLRSLSSFFVLNHGSKTKLTFGIGQDLPENNCFIAWMHFNLNVQSTSLVWTSNS